MDPIPLRDESEGADSAAMREARGAMREAREAMGEAREARRAAEVGLSKAVAAFDKAVKVEQDLFGGDPGRPGDPGLLRKLEDGMRAMRAQNWAILIALLGLIVTLAGAVFAALHH